MIILDNIIFYLQKSGGVSVVWSELLKRLLSNNNFLVLCLEYGMTDNLNRKELVIPSVNIQERNFDLLKSGRYFSPKINKKDKFIFHSSYYRTCSSPYAINVTTVHDFTYEYYYTGLKKRLHCWQKYTAIRKSDYIICVSENTRKDLLKFMPEIDCRKVRVIYNGVSNEYFSMDMREDSDESPFPYRSYVLFVGSREKYKNFELVVRSVAQSSLNLIIVGSDLSDKEFLFLNEMLGASRFKSVGRVSNKTLNYLYNDATALLYPSEYEGFGIPVLEAQKAGCPVIAYNASSIPEIIGDTPLLLNTLSIESIIECLDKLKIEKDRETIVSNGIENAKRFTWDRMYEQVITLYEEAWEASNK